MNFSQEALVALKNGQLAQEEWVPPEIFDLGSSEDIERFNDTVAQTEKNGVRLRCYDPIQEIAESLFECDFPDLKEDPVARAAYVKDIYEQGSAYGRHVFFPAEALVVRYPTPLDHRRLRTSRNVPLDTREEQSVLEAATILFAGLSVGSSGLFSVVQAGIGNHVIAADFDRIDPTNLGRIGATMEDVGRLKTDWAAQRVSKMDPYIKLTLMPDGITKTTLEQLEGLNPTIIVEAVDNFAVKALLRRWAEDHGVPLLMPADVDDKAMVDVERHDLKGTKPFLGRIKEDDIDDYIADRVDTRAAMLRLTGLGNVSTKMMIAASEEGHTIAGLPQRGTTTAVAGAIVAVAAREIILEKGLPGSRHKLPSGRGMASLRAALDLGRTHSPNETLRAAVNTVKLAKKKQKAKDEAAGASE